MQNNEVILCADDFGYTEGVSIAIIELCQSGKLNATSVMVESPLIEYYAPLLAKHADHVQIGLHFNLTEPFGQEAFSLSSLMFSLRLSPTKKQQVAERLTQQLTQFEKLFGRSPDFIDGHQHIHILPSVRDIFLNIIEQRYGNNSGTKPWIRQVSPPFSHTDAYLKVLILNLFNIGFRKQCKKHYFNYNEKFDGVYSLTTAVSYEKLLRIWLNRSSKKTLIMCHPSKDIHTSDVIAEARLQEYKVLSKH